MGKRRNEQTLGEAISDLVKTYKLNTKLDEVELRHKWDEVMGEYISTKTRDVKLRGKTLILYLDSAPLKEELLLSRTKIIETFNEEFGRVVIEEVVIR